MWLLSSRHQHLSNQMFFFSFLKFDGIFTFFREFFTLFRQTNWVMKPSFIRFARGTNITMKFDHLHLVIHSFSVRVYATIKGKSIFQRSAASTAWKRVRLMPHTNNKLSFALLWNLSNLWAKILFIRACSSIWKLSRRLLQLSTHFVFCMIYQTH